MSSILTSPCVVEILVPTAKHVPPLVDATSSPTAAPSAATASAAAASAAAALLANAPSTIPATGIRTVPTTTTSPSAPGKLANEGSAENVPAPHPTWARV